mgnify:FL=1
MKKRSFGSEELPDEANRFIVYLVYLLDHQIYLLPDKYDIIIICLMLFNTIICFLSFCFNIGFTDNYYFSQSFLTHGLRKH